MNSNTSSVLAIVSRVGKLLGALFVIIGLIVIVSTVGNALNATLSASSSYSYGYGYGSSSSAVNSAQQASETVLGAINFMCVGAYVMFFFAIMAVIFNVVAKENVAGSLIDVLVALVGFIMNFIIADPMNKFSNVSSSDLPGAIIGFFTALIFLILSAGIVMRAAFPGDPIFTRTKPAVYTGSTYGAGAYQNNGYAAPNAGYQNNGYATPNAGYQNNGYAAPTAGYQNNGYAAPNAGYQNSGYSAPNSGIQNNGYAAPNTSYQNNGYNNTPNGGRM